MTKLKFTYWRRLNERTLSEMQIYERTRRELEKETRPRMSDINAQLQSMGIYPLPLPDSLRSYQNTLDFDER